MTAVIAPSGTGALPVTSSAATAGSAESAATRAESKLAPPVTVYRAPRTVNVAVVTSARTVALGERASSTAPRGTVGATRS